MGGLWCKARICNVRTQRRVLFFERFNLLFFLADTLLNSMLQRRVMLLQCRFYMLLIVVEILVELSVYSVCIGELSISFLEGTLEVIGVLVVIGLIVPPGRIDDWSNRGLNTLGRRPLLNQNGRSCSSLAYQLVRLQSSSEATVATGSSTIICGTSVCEALSSCRTGHQRAIKCRLRP